MGRRYFGNNGERYCGNTKSREVHDLDNERANCQIDEIIRAGHARPFATAGEAARAGYDKCSHCL